MKKRQLLLLTIALALFASQGHSQNMGINEDGSTPNPNAILDIKSFTKGLLIPRVSTSGRLAIPNTKGLLVYDTTAGSFWYNTGSAWQNMAAAGSTGGGWSLTGNSGTTGNNFLGTTDTASLRIRVNNFPSGLIDFNNGNAFWGQLSGAAIQNGHKNTAIGGSSLKSLTDGFGNLAAGYSSMFSNTTGGHNTAVGYQSLLSNTTGGDNTAGGSDAMHANTTGGLNTAYGSSALQDNTTGSNSVAVGFAALQSSTTGHDNTATGNFSLLFSLTGSNNTASGSGSLEFNTSGDQNTADGFNSLQSNTTGANNTAVGGSSLSNNASGNNNTAIGWGANVSSDNLTNATAIGFNASVNASNKVRIGNSSVTVIEGQVPFTTPSDGRFKYQVKEDVKGLDFILQLRPVTYQFDVQRFDQHLHGNDRATGGNPDGIIPAVAHPQTNSNNAMQASYNEAASIRRSGFIAQEVEKAAQVSGYNFSGIVRPRTEQDHYSLSYESFVVPLVKGMQEQQKIILAQQEQLADLQRQLDELRQLIRQGSK